MLSDVKTTQIQPMTTAEKLALANSPSGTIVFDTDIGVLQTTEDDGATWINIVGAETSTKAYAEMYFNDNTTATVITTPGTFVKVEGTYNVDAGAISDFTHVNGVLTYTGTDTKLMKVICPLSLTFDLDNDTITSGIFKNGVELANSKSSQDTFLGSTSPAYHNNVVSVTTEMSTNDTIEIRVTTENVSNDLFIRRLNFIIEDFSAGASGGGGGGGDFLEKTSNLSDVNDIITSGRNLGITDGAVTLLAGDGSETYTANNQPRFIYLFNNTVPGHSVQLCEFDSPNSPKLGDTFCTVFNGGTESYNIRDSIGSILVSIAENEVYEFVGRDNSPNGGIGIISRASSVNNKVGDVVLDGSEIDSTHTGVNYTETGPSIDGQIAGIDTALATAGITPTVLFIGMTRSPITSTPPDNTYVNMITSLGGTETFAANTLKVGDVLEYKASGVFVGTGTGADIQIELRFNGVSIDETPLNQINSFSDSRPFHFLYRISIGDDVSPSLLESTAACTGYFGDTGGTFTPFSFPVLNDDLTNTIIIDKTIANSMQVFAKTTDNTKFFFSASNITIVKYSL